LDASEIVGQRLALILFSEGPSGGEEGAVIAGTVEQDGASILFTHDDGTIDISDWLDRIKTDLPADIRELHFGCEYSLSLTVGNVGDASTPAELRRTGLRWPSAN
jgi:hypothetical protein